MLNVPLAEAKNRLSELVLRAEGGEEIAICKRGKVKVRLVPVSGSRADHRSEVAQIFQNLRRLSCGMRLEGNLKDIARKGLD